VHGDELALHVFVPAGETAVLDAHLAHPPAGELLAVDLHGDAEVLLERRALRADRRRVDDAAGSRSQRAGVVEDPRVADGAPGDPGDVDAGLAEHADDVLRREQVAAAEDRAVG
jgi:hypothetical protein